MKDTTYTKDKIGTRIRVDLSADEWRRLRIAAARNELSVRQAASQALRDYADLHEPAEVKP